MIRLLPGVHTGPLVVTVPDLTVIAEPGAVLDGQKRGTVLTVRAPGFTLKGLTITGSGTSPYGEDAAVKLLDVTGCTLSGNTVDGTFFGIVLNRSPHNRITDNVLRGDAPIGKFERWGDGIRVWNSRDNMVTGNRVHRFRDGLYLEFANRTRIEGNLCRENQRYGLHFMFMDDSSFRHNRFLDNQAGTVLMYSKRITVTDNVFAGNQGSIGQGVLFKENNDGRLSRNRILDNTVGLFIDGSARNRIANNLVAGNGWGCLLFSSAIGNRFTGNRFIGNGYDMAVDMRRSRNTLEGNYWDGYRGYDLDGDGYGDKPYAPVSVFAYLTMQYPDLFAFSGSPAMQALDYAQRQLPALSPSALQDPRPLMRPEGRR